MEPAELLRDMGAPVPSHSPSLPRAVFFVVFISEVIKRFCCCLLRGEICPLVRTNRCFGNSISKWADEDRYTEFGAFSCRMLFLRSLGQRLESLPHRAASLGRLGEPDTAAWLTSPVGKISLSWPRSPESCFLYSSII